MTRLFINFGKMDQMFPNRLIELINRCIPGRVNIGRIDLMPRFAFFDVDEFEAKNVVETLNRYEVDGRRIHVEYADAKKDYAGGKKAEIRTFPLVAKISTGDVVKIPLHAKTKVAKRNRRKDVSTTSSTPNSASVGSKKPAQSCYSKINSRAACGDRTIRSKSLGDT